MKGSFTLIELLVVIIILSMLAAIVLPRYHNFVNAYTVTCIDEEDNIHTAKGPTVIRPNLSKSGGYEVWNSNGLIAAFPREMRCAVVSSEYN